MPRIKVLYTLGAGHCGSTLLNLALDMHPEILGVGEIISLNAEAPGYATGVNLHTNLFWSAVADEYGRRLGSSFWEVPFHPNVNGRSVQESEWVDRNRHALESMACIACKPIVADSSKEACRLEGLLGMPEFSVKVLYLIRDPRAIVHSYDRKYDSLLVGVRKLARIHRQAMRIKARIAKSDWLTLRYEDLATNFQASLRKVCAFTEVPFDPALLTPSPSTYRGIGGNRMREKSFTGVRVDDSWRHEMSNTKQLLTGAVFSRYILEHGYGFR